MAWTTIAAALAALGAGAYGYLSQDADVTSEDKEVFKSKILNSLDKNSPIYDYVKHNLTASQLYNIVKENELVDVQSKFGEWFDWDDNETIGSYEDEDFSEIVDMLNELGSLNFDESEYPEYVYLEDLEDSVRAELEAEDARQVELFENQLQENQMMFDDYRSQLLGNQYRQNAQLMGTVDSAMSKARRNALEAGASAGLRMAENINTTLALQNKQAQTSLETSNQLAQQLLNQRQASAGIRSNYSDMLASKSDRYYNRINNARDLQKQKNDEAYSKYLSGFDNMNAFSSGYAEYLKNKNQNTSNVTNKTNSQYN